MHVSMLTSLRILAVLVCCIASSGCLFRTLRMENADIGLPVKLKSGAAEGDGSSGRFYRIELAEFKNGAGHEFEAAVVFEALKELFTSERYFNNSVTGFLQKIPEYAQGYGARYEEALLKEYERAVDGVLREYALPEYELHVKVSRLAAMDPGPPVAPKVYRFTDRLEMQFTRKDWESATVPSIDSRRSSDGSMHGYVPELKRLVGHYTEVDALWNLGKWSWTVVWETVKTPFFVLQPFKWNQLVALERFSPRVGKDDPMRNTRLSYSLAGNVEFEPPLVDLRGYMHPVLIEVSILRKSKFNEAIKRGVDRIDEFDELSSALSSNYGAAGKLVGRLVEERFKEYVKSQVKASYYSDEVLFKGQTIVGAGNGGDIELTGNQGSDETSNSARVVFRGSAAP